MAESKTNRRITISEIIEWDGSWELIDGIPYNMTPAPTTHHQQIVGELFFALRTHFGNDGCSVFVAPYDIQIDEVDEYTIVQPDISVFCNKNQVGEKRAQGASDLMIEVLSPSTALKDRNHKFNLYERTGVTEYWLADPHNKTIEVYGLSEGRYLKRQVFGHEDTLSSFVFSELTIDLNKIFSN
ncbi:Uma2 family endonuclease [Sporosarcina sp. FSL K6-3457]|uniref:Uma2 family endonuclease n=1 Tax=Sporosarcina sp. FSL K6-3457 TaxID=2978204 RepID=UPI0030FB9A91